MNKAVAFRKPFITEDGSILLNEDDPEDVEWYEEG